MIFADYLNGRHMYTQSGNQLNIITILIIIWAVNSLFTSSETYWRAIWDSFKIEIKFIDNPTLSAPQKSTNWKLITPMFEDISILTHNLPTSLKAKLLFT